MSFVQGLQDPQIADPHAFAAALLGMLGYPQSESNINAIVAWYGHEGGNWQNSAAFNPLNTTMRESDSRSINSVGVQAYNSWEEGLSATVATLRNGNYQDILNALASGNAAPAFSAGLAGLSKWSGGGYGSVAATGTPGTAAAAGSAPATAAAQSFANTTVPFSGPGLSGYFNVTEKYPDGTTKPTQMVVYDLGNGIRVYYDASEPGTSINTQGVASSNVTADQFYSQTGMGWAPGGTLIHGGTIQDLLGLSLGGKSYQDYINQQLNQYAIGHPDWLANPEVKSLLVQRALGVIPDDATLTLDIEQTSYWKNQTSGQQTWSNLSPAEQQQRVGASVPQVQQMYGQWGIQSDPSTLNGWATNIANGTKTTADLQAQLQAQSVIQYPWMSDFAKQGIDTKTAAAPWLSAYTSIMEKPADLLNASIQKALTQGTPVYQFKQQLMNDPAWLNTENAKQVLPAAVATIGQKMGFNA